MRGAIFRSERQRLGPSKKFNSNGPYFVSLFREKKTYFAIFRTKFTKKTYFIKKGWFEMFFPLPSRPMPAFVPFQKI